MNRRLHWIAAAVIVIGAVAGMSAWGAVEAASAATAPDPCAYDPGGAPEWEIVGAGCDPEASSPPDSTPDPPPPDPPPPDPATEDPGAGGSADPVDPDQPWVGFCDTVSALSSDSDLLCTMWSQTAAGMSLLTKTVSGGATDGCSSIATAFGFCGGDSGGWKPYQFTFAIGVVIAILSLLVTVGRAVDGTNVRAMSMVLSAGVRGWLYVPAMMVAPWILVQFQDVANSAGDTLLEQAGATMFDALMTELFGVFKVTSVAGFLLAILKVMGMAATFTVFLIALVVLIVGVIVELTIADQAAYLTLCLLPIGMALSIYPRFRKAGMAIIGVLIGLILIKPAIGLALWASADRVANASGLAQWIGMFVALAVSMCVGALAPSVLGKFMPMIGGGNETRTAATQGYRTMSSGSHKAVDTGVRMYKGAKAGASTDAAAQSAQTGKEVASVTARSGGGAATSASAAGGGLGVAAYLALAAARSATKVPQKAASTMESQSSAPEGRQPYDVGRPPTPPKAPVQAPASQPAPPAAPEPTAPPAPAPQAQQSAATAGSTWATQRPSPPNPPATRG